MNIRHSWDILSKLRFSSAQRAADVTATAASASPVSTDSELAEELLKLQR